MITLSYSRAAFVFAVAALLVGAASPARADWSQRHPGHGPDGRTLHGMAFDSARGRTVLFGGLGANANGDTWEWDGDDWTRVPTDVAPGPRYGLALGYCAAAHGVVLFGGQDDQSNDLGDTWVWDGNAWTPLVLVLGPSPRHFAAVAYDSARARLVLFGGKGANGPLGDTWEFDGSAWILVHPAASPSPRYLHAMAYDASRGKVVLFGGTNDSGTHLGDTWEWDGTAWTLDHPTASPGARFGAAMSYDPARKMVQLFGGRGTDKDRWDLWEFDGTMWVQRPEKASPFVRHFHAMAIDQNGKIILFGGSGNRSDTWELPPVDTTSEIVCGRGAGGGGGVDTLGNLLVGLKTADLTRIPWNAYDAAIGEGRVACGHLTGEPWEQIVVSQGSWPGSGGWVVILDHAINHHAVLKWIRIQWTAYNNANGETHPACGDLDGDGTDEIVLGLGKFTAAGGYFVTLGDASTGYAVQRWQQVPAGAYNQANGETHPACGDLDGDGKQEIVVGLGAFPSAGGYAYIFGDAAAHFAYQRSVRFDWTAYDSASGATWPACGDVDGDGKADIVLGCGKAPGASGWVRVLGDAAGNFAGLTWLPCGWGAYAAANGELRPAVGNLEGSSSACIVLGLGPMPNWGGYFPIFRGAAGGYARVQWAHVGGDAYNRANGELWPAIGRVR